MISELMKGLSITLSHFFKKPVTLQYPDVKMQMYPRFRGSDENYRYENGLRRGVCCGFAAPFAEAVPEESDGKLPVRLALTDVPPPAIAC
jgi:hypothetical protein